MAREGNDNDVTNIIAKHFPEVVDMRGFPLTQSNAHALGYVMRRVTTRIEVLGFNGCNLNSASFSHISEAIKEMPGSVS